MWIHLHFLPSTTIHHNLSIGTATQFIMYLCHYIEIFVCYDACHLQNVLLDYIQPCRRQCTQSNNDINNNSCMLKWDKSRLWILMHSPVIYGTADHTVSRCTYGKRKVHNIHKWHSQIKCINIKIRSLWTTMVRRNIQPAYHLMLNFETLHTYGMFAY